MSEQPSAIDRHGERLFPIVLVSAAALAVLFGTKHGLRKPPLVWASWTVLVYGCLPLAAGLLVDGWRSRAARAWGALGSLVVLGALVAGSWLPDVRSAFQDDARLILVPAALGVGLVLVGALHGGIDLGRWGLGLGDWRWWAPRTGLLVLGTFLLVAIWFHVDPSMDEYYPSEPAARESLGALLLFCAVVGLYMLGWETFWRGSLLFGLARCWGPLPAILFGGIPFMLLHRGKPESEMVASFVGGCLLSWFCWRGKSAWPAVLLHAVLNLSVQVAGFVI